MRAEVLGGVAEPVFAEGGGRVRRVPPWWARGSLLLVDEDEALAVHDAKFVRGVDGEVVGGPVRQVQGHVKVVGGEPGRKREETIGL